MLTTDLIFPINEKLVCLKLPKEQNSVPSLQIDVNTKYVHQVKNGLQNSYECI